MYREVFQSLVSLKRYFCSLENLVELAIIVLSTILLVFKVQILVFLCSMLRLWGGEGGCWEDEMNIKVKGINGKVASDLVDTVLKRIVGI